MLRKEDEKKIKDIHTYIISIVNSIFKSIVFDLCKKIYFALILFVSPFENNNCEIIFFKISSSFKFTHCNSIFFSTLFFHSAQFSFNFSTLLSIQVQIVFYVHEQKCYKLSVCEKKLIFFSIFFLCLNTKIEVN